MSFPSSQSDLFSLTDPPKPGSLPRADSLFKGQCRSRNVSTYFMLKSCPKPHINADIFDEYIRILFLPYLNRVRSLEEFARAAAVVVINTRPRYVGQIILTLPRDARIRVIIWPHHRTHLFQNRAISLFGVRKRREQPRFPFVDDDGTAGVSNRQSSTPTSGQPFKSRALSLPSTWSSIASYLMKK